MQVVHEISQVGAENVEGGKRGFKINKKMDKKA